MDQRYLSLQKRTLRGSLPLKKRRLIDVSPPLQFGFGPTDFNATSTTYFNLAKLQELPITRPASGRDEKIAALALVAAAASASHSPILKSVQNALSLQQSSAPARVSLEAVGFPSEPYCWSAEAASDGSSVSSEASGSSHVLDRAHTPQMECPLPGGCHGLTSRSNAYCRKLPCYKGSTYCKLHYQQYIVLGNQMPSFDEEEETSSHGLADHAPVSSPSTSASHQDKRYTGTVGAICCRATTTRGRACAYMAVNGTGYCNLHAEYDTNPPPRRGSAGFKSNINSFALAPAEVSVASPPSVTSEESSRFPSPLPEEKALEYSQQRRGSNASHTGRRMSSKLAGKHADSPYPLLSMISTDQWFGKTVTISTGPLAKRIGQVEKWGNGWVSVRIPGVGLHNRRSFELFLHLDGENDGQTSLRKEQPSSIAVDQDASLLRCVSRDAVSPSPTLKTDISIKALPTATQQLGCRTFDTEDAPRCFTVSVPAHVYDTPRPEKELIEIQQSEPANLFFPVGSPIPVNGTPYVHSGAPGSEISEVTPVPERKAITDLSLVQSLVLSQAVGTKKYNLDMLFGTAALERSRRTVHKPARYEDTAMISRKRRRNSMEGSVCDSDSGSKFCIDNLGAP